MVGIWLDDQDLIDKLVQRFGNNESAQFRKDTYSLIVALWYDDLLFYYAPFIEEDGEPHMQVITQKSISSDPATVSFYVRSFNKMMTKGKFASASDVDDAFVTKCLLALKDEATMKEVNSTLTSDRHKDLCLKSKPSKWNKYKFPNTSYEDWVKEILGAYSRK